MPAQLRILSAGAVKPGLTGVIELFRRDTGEAATVSFATAPSILKRIADGEPLDIVIAPRSVLDDLAKTGTLAEADYVSVGRIGVGVLVREGAPLPQIATVEDFKEALLSAESLVYNRASTGIYLAELFGRLGIGNDLKAKSTRYPDFAAVLDHVSKGKGWEVGLGATTVIIENESRGVKFAGPLPAEIQNYTTYAAGIVAGGGAKEAARRFIRYLSSPAAKSLLSAAGLQ
jgi:molybdate transport system substrate-binding protein